MENSAHSFTEAATYTEPEKSTQNTVDHTELMNNKNALISTINSLSSWTDDTPEAQVLDIALNSAKQRINEAVETIKSELEFYLKIK